MLVQRQKPRRLIGIVSAQEEVLAMPMTGYLGVGAGVEAGVEAAAGNFKHFLKDPEKMVAGIAAVADRFGFDEVCLPMDLTEVAQALGAKSMLWAGMPPSVHTYQKGRGNVAVVQSKDDIGKIEAALDELSPEKTARLPIFLEAAKRLAETLGPDKLTRAYVTGPFTTAGNLISLHNLMAMLGYTPDLVKSVVEVSSKACLRYAEALADTGVDTITISEMSGGIGGPSPFKEFSMPHLKQMVELIEDKGVMADIHICGRSKHLIEPLMETGAGSLRLDSFELAGIDGPETAEKLSGKGMVLISGVSPPDLIRESTDEVERLTLEVLQTMRGHRNFAIGSGCTLFAGTVSGATDEQQRAAWEKLYENVTAYSDTVKKFNQKKYADKKP